jgi:hypothetical protein
MELGVARDTKKTEHNYKAFHLKDFLKGLSERTTSVALE